MLTPDEIEDIITDLSCRNAAGGIYTGSVHPFARAVERAVEAAAIERCANVCESTYAKDAFHFELGTACAKAIRALLPKEEG